MEEKRTFVDVDLKIYIYIYYIVMYYVYRDK